MTNRRPLLDGLFVDDGAGCSLLSHGGELSVRLDFMAFQASVNPILNIVFVLFTTHLKLYLVRLVIMLGFLCPALKSLNSRSTKMILI